MESPIMESELEDIYKSMLMYYLGFSKSEIDQMTDDEFINNLRYLKYIREKEAAANAASKANNLLL